MHIYTQITNLTDPSLFLIQLKSNKDRVAASLIVFCTLGGVSGIFGT